MGETVTTGRDSVGATVIGKHNFVTVNINPPQSGQMGPADVARRRPRAALHNVPELIDHTQPDNVWSSIVCLRHEDGQIAGSGVLVSGRFDTKYVLTCSTIVLDIYRSSSACDDTKSTEVPDNFAITVSFPGISYNNVVGYLDEYWPSINDTVEPSRLLDFSDISLIKLKEAPTETKPAMLLADTSSLELVPSAAYAFPKGESPRGNILYLTATAFNRSRLELTPENATQWIYDGFSGGPIWDLNRQGVFGIVTDPLDNNTGFKRGLAIPASIATCACPQLRSDFKPNRDCAGFLYNVPARPAHHVIRARAFSDVKATLLSGSMEPVAILGQVPKGHHEGLPGIGKTVLAAAVAHDTDVRLAFPGGIFWLTFAQKAPLTELFGVLIKGLSGKEEKFDTLQMARDIAADNLKHNAEKTLIILDNVIDIKDIKEFSFAEYGARILATTRSEIQPDAVAQVRLPFFTKAEAIQFCLRYLKEKQPYATDNVWYSLNHINLTASVETANELIPISLVLLCDITRDKEYSWQDVNAMARDEVSLAKKDSYPGIGVAVSVSLKTIGERARELLYYLTVAFPRQAMRLGVLASISEESVENVEKAVSLLKRRSLVEINESDDVVNLHESIREVVFNRLAEAGQVEQRHKRIVDAYRKKAGACYPRWWSALRDDGYVYYSLPYHLHGQKCCSEVYNIITDFIWVARKTEYCGVDYVANDFQLIHNDDASSGEWPSLAEHALSLSAHVVRRDHRQVGYQLLGRLSQYERYSEIHQLLEGCRKHAIEVGKAGPDSLSLLLRSGSLNPAGGPLWRVLAGPAAPVLCVAVSVEKPVRVAAGCYDGSVWVWDLHTGKLEAMWPIKEGSKDETENEKHEGPVAAIAISRNGGIVVTGGWDRTIRLWKVQGNIVIGKKSGAHSGESAA